MKLTTPVVGLAAGVLLATGALAGATLAGGDDGRDPTPLSATAAASTGDDLSGPCDEAEHAADPRCTGTSAPGSTAAPDGGTAAPAPAPAGELRSFAAASAGVVSYTVDGGGFHLVAATPADGWAVEVEQAAGDEIDLDFRQGAVRVQVDVEHEDGQIRERVRVRDDATDERTEDEVFVGSPAAPAPTAVDDHGGDVDRDDRVEPGDDRDDRDDDSSGHGGDDDDDRGDDDDDEDEDEDEDGDSSGSGGDDDGDDD